MVLTYDNLSIPLSLFLFSWFIHIRNGFSIGWRKWFFNSYYINTLRWVKFYKQVLKDWCVYIFLFDFGVMKFSRRHSWPHDIEGIQCKALRNPRNLDRYSYFWKIIIKAIFVFLKDYNKGHFLALFVLLSNMKMSSSSGSYTK